MQRPDGDVACAPIAERIQPSRRARSVLGRRDVPDVQHLARRRADENDPAAPETENWADVSVPENAVTPLPSAAEKLAVAPNPIESPMTLVNQYETSLLRTSVDTVAEVTAP